MDNSLDETLSLDAALARTRQTRPHRRAVGNLLVGCLLVVYVFGECFRCS